MKKNKKYPIIYLQWIDAQEPHTGWSYEKEIDYKGAKVETCGFLIKKTKKTYSIALNVWSGGNEYQDQISRIINIPTCLIFKTRIVK